MMLTRAVCESLGVPADLTVFVDALPEIDAPEGNASAWDDEDANRAYWAEIRDRMDSGDEWAWCIVRVTVTDGETEGTAYLGGCCYANARDFVENSGCMEDLATEALERYRYAAAGIA